MQTRPRQNYRLKRVKSWRRQSRIFIELRRRKRTLVKQRRRRRPLKLRGSQRIVLVRRGKITRRKTRRRRNREINLGQKTLSTKWMRKRNPPLLQRFLPCRKITLVTRKTRKKSLKKQKLYEI